MGMKSLRAERRMPRRASNLCRVSSLSNRMHATVGGALCPDGLRRALMSGRKAPPTVKPRYLSYKFFRGRSVIVVTTIQSDHPHRNRHGTAFAPRRCGVLDAD